MSEIYRKEEEKLVVEKEVTEVIQTDIPALERELVNAQTLLARAQAKVDEITTRIAEGKKLGLKTTAELEAEKEAARLAEEAKNKVIPEEEKGDA